MRKPVRKSPERERLPRRLRRSIPVAAVTMLILLGAFGATPAAAETGGDVVDIDIVQTSPDSAGVYLTHSNGWVEARDLLPHFGDHPPLRPGEKVIALSARKAGDGYWLFTDRGRAFNYGAAPFLGDADSLDLSAPIVSAVATPDGEGYYMVGQDGGIFAYGTARFHGSVPQVLPGVTLAAPVIGIAPSETGNGYLLVASDGGIFTFGDARFLGSIPGVLPGVQLDQPVVGVIPQPDGYLMVAADGGIFTFGQTEFLGSLGGAGETGIVGVGVLADNSGYLMVDSRGYTFPFGLTEYLAQVVYTGTGHSQFSIRKPAPGAVLLRYHVAGEGRFEVGSFAAPGGVGTGAPVDVTATGARSGVTLLDGPNSRGNASDLGILSVYAEEGVSWVIGLQTLVHAPVLSRHQSFSASGPQVFFLPPSTSESPLTLTVASPDWTNIWWYPVDGFGGRIVKLDGPGVTHGSVDGQFGLMFIDTGSANWALGIG